MYSVISEVLEISPNVYSVRQNPSWTIAKPVDTTKAEQFRNLVDLLMKLVSVYIASHAIL